MNHHTADLRRYSGNAGDRNDLQSWHGGVSLTTQFTWHALDTHS